MYDSGASRENHKEKYLLATVGKRNGSGMKIAFFLDTPYGLGGAGNLLLQQAGLMSKLHDIVVVVPCGENGGGNEEYIKRCKKKGLPYQVLYYKVSTDFYCIDYIQAMECKKSIIDFAVRENITFFHSVQLNIAVEMAARERKIPHVMDIYQLKEEEFALAYADIYPHYHLCDSELYAKRWSNVLGITSKCVRPVAPLDKIMEKDHSEKRCYKIVMLGAVCERKNQLAAIKAVEKCLGQYPVSLEIAGDAESIYGKQCRDYVERQGIGRNIHFLGFLSDIGSLLEECDCLLCASMDESFPSSIVEAVTYDLTVIATPVAGVPEIFRNEYNAFITEGYDETHIYRAIISCLKSYADGSIAFIHTNAKNTWKDFFSPETVGNEINGYYMAIIADGKTGDGTVYDSQPLKEVNALYKTLWLEKTLSLELGEFIGKKIWYCYFLKKKIGKGKACIWGAGKLGGLAFELVKILELEIEITAFIDMAKTGQYCGKPIRKPTDIDYGQTDYVFISFAGSRDEVVKYLCENGMVYHKNVFLLGC